MNIAELVEPQTYAEEQEAQEQKFRYKPRNTKMLLGRGIYSAKRWLGQLFFWPVWYRHTILLVSYFGHWPCYDFLYFLFSAYHSFGAGWSEVSSGKRNYCNLRHSIKFEILAAYLEEQIKQRLFALPPLINN